jgi:hypothetical protein
LAKLGSTMMLTFKNSHTPRAAGQHSVSIMVPELGIALRPDGVTIQGYDQQQLNEVNDFLKSTSLTPFESPSQSIRMSTERSKITRLSFQRHLQRSPTVNTTRL